MSNYYLKIILLENCPYSIALDELINKNNIIHKKNWITSLEKDKFKTNLINTFPQIYLNKYNSKGNLLFGGFSDFNDFFSVFKNKKFNESNITQYINKLKWSKKAVLRLIQLINL